MRKAFFLWLVYLYTVILSFRHIKAEDVALESKIGQSAMFKVDITAIKNKTGLQYFYHPSTNVLFQFAPLSNGGRKVFVPSQSIYRSRIQDERVVDYILSFQLQMLEIQDGGLYYCEDKLCHQKLIILDKPSKPIVQLNSPQVAYSTAELTCVTNSTSVPGDHGLVMRYIWRTNNIVIADSPNVTLELPLTRSNKGDKLTCQSYERDVFSDNSEPFILDPDFGPEKITLSSDSDIKIAEGQSVSVSCSVECKPQCDIEWKYQGVAISNINILTLTNITREQDGNYTCQACNKHGTSSKILSIDILYTPLILSEKVSDGSDLNDIIIMENSALNITFVIDSNPKPEIMWTKDAEQTDNIITETMGPDVKLIDIKRQEYTSALKIPQAFCRNMGMYYASIRNSLGRIQSPVISLTVLCSPRLDKNVYFKREFSPDLGDDINIQMKITSYPKPEIKSIYHNTSKIDMSEFSIVNKSTDKPYGTIFMLEKSNIGLKDFGHYKIELFNTNAQPVNISIYIKEKGRPSVPIQIEIVKRTATSVTLRWISSFNGGSVQTFNVWYKRLYGNWTFYNQTYHDPGEGEAIRAEVKNLQQLTTYQFKVASTNKYGRSDFSLPITAKTIELDTDVSSAGLSESIGMWIGIGLGSLVFIIILCVLIVVCRRRYLKNKKENFFRELREAGVPMMPNQSSFSDSKENHLYEEIPERKGPQNNNVNHVSTAPPPKPPRTFVEPVVKKPEPIWKPSERKLPKVNENTEHLQIARKSLKPVVNKGQL